MDGSEISSILFQALRGATRLCQQGAATKKALLLAIGAAAKIGQPSEEAEAGEAPKYVERKEETSPGGVRAAPKPRPLASEPRPCRLADKGCKESHAIIKCRVFSRMSAEQKLAVLQENQLCLFCYKHPTSQECFVRADRSY